MGAYVWLDEAEIKVGDSLIQKIRDGIDRVDYFGVVLSLASTRSEWVSRELDLAMSLEIDGRRVRVLPILLEECELPSFLLGKLYADFRHDFNTGVAALSARLGIAISRATPHQPTMRSFEIPVPVKSADQVPRLATNRESLFLQWFEEGDRGTRVYVYTLDRATLTLNRAIGYDLPGEVADHFLVSTDTQVLSLANTTLDWTEFALCLVDVDGAGSVPIIVENVSGQIDSIVSSGCSLLASSTKGHLLTLFELDGQGRLLRQNAKTFTHPLGDAFLVPSASGAGVVIGTTAGVARVRIGHSLALSDFQIIIPVEVDVERLADVPVHLYDNCCVDAAGTLLIVGSRANATGMEIQLFELPVDASVVEGRALPIATTHGNPFKQSMIVADNRLLVLWNEEEEFHGNSLLRCMLFDRNQLAPLWPYERTLTSWSNYASGVPAITIDGRCYVAYLEETGSRFKVKLTEFDLQSAAQIAPRVLRWS